MTNFPWLTALLLVPTLGALLVAFLPGPVERAKQLAIATSLVTLALGIGAALAYDTGASGAFQLAEVHPWIPQFGVSYALGVDGMSLVLILLSVILVPVVLLAAWNDVPEGGQREKTYFALMLVLESFMIGVFAATDVFLFYVFFEAMLIPVYFLIGSYGGPRRQYASLKFLLFSLAGGLIMLVAVIAAYRYGPGGSDGFLVENLAGRITGSATAERLMFLGFFIAFAVKAPMVPVHTWLPDAASEAKAGTSVLLVGVLDKVGTYGMIRFCLELFPSASKWATPVVMVLAVISVLYGALLAIGQSDMMRLIAYTSVSHFGFIVLGIFAMTKIGMSGSVLYMVNHGFSTGALFLIAAMLISRRGSKRLEDFGGWQRVTPVIAGSFLIAGLSAASLPGLSTFVSEYLVFLGTFQSYRWAALIALPGVVLAAVYVLWMYKRAMTGPKPEIGGIGDMTLREKLVVAPILVAILVLGIFPRLALDVINPAVDTTVSVVEGSAK